MSIPLMLLVLLLLATCAMVGYRKYVTRDEDDLVHLGEGSLQHSTRQEAMSQTLNQLDKITRILIAATVLYALGLGGAMIYQALQNGPGPS